MLTCHLVMFVVVVVEPVSVPVAVGVVWGTVVDHRACGIDVGKDMEFA